MKINIVFIVFTLSTYVCGEDCTINPDVRESAATNLKKDLFEKYDTSIRPVKTVSTVTNVFLHLMLKHIEYRELTNANELQVNAWAIWHWHDEFLKWEPQCYENITRLLISSSDIWVPDIILFSSSDILNAATIQIGARCFIYYDGAVDCVPPMVYKILCHNDFTIWPFDIHNCSLRFNPWEITGKHLNLSLGAKGFSTEIYLPNHKWNLMSVEATRYDDRGLNATLKYDFILQRHCYGLAAIILIPALVLSALILTTFWVVLEGLSRMCLCSMNIIIDCLYLQYITNSVIPNGDSIPIIVTFYRDLLFLAGISLFITVTLRNITEYKTLPPVWVSNIFKSIVNSSPGQIFMFPHEFAETAAGTDKNGAPLTSTVKWRNVVQFLDRTFFCVFCLVMLCLLIGYIPKKL